MELKYFDSTVKLILIGDTGVGKSSLLSCWINKEFTHNAISTIGIDFQCKIINVDDLTLKVHIYDTAGQERFRSIIQSYFRIGHGVILVYAIDNKQSFDNLTYWVNSLEAYNPLAMPSLIIVGNKTDKVENRIVSYSSAKKFAHEHNALYIETSAKDVSVVDEMFLLAIKSAVKNKQITPSENQIIINVSEESKNIGCYPLNVNIYNNIKNKMSEWYKNICE